MEAFSPFWTHLAGELLQTITLLKMAVSVLVVIGLSILAEVVSPKFAGIISGYPLGAAISLFFIGIEVGPQFAAQSAMYTMAGLVATQAFAYVYYRASLLASNRSRLADILMASAAGVLTYFLFISFLHAFELNLIEAVLAPAVSIGVFIFLFRNVPNVKIENRVGFNLKTMFWRSIAAGLLIVLITSSAKIVGPRWAGLFSVFPVTMLPFVMIIHFTYDREHVYSILKNVPKGIGSVIFYCIAVYVCYPSRGVVAGTAIAYLFATLYLVALHIRVPLPMLQRCAKSHEGPP